MGDQKKFDIKVIVSGQATVVSVFEDEPLSKLVDDALQQTRNSGQPAGNWRLHTLDGTELEELEQDRRRLRLHRQDRTHADPKGGGWWESLTWADSTWTP